MGSADESLCSLLGNIEKTHGIPSEICDVSHQGAYDPQKEKEVYERDFKPRAKTLKKRTGRSIEKNLRSRKTRNYFVSIPGTIAVVSDQGVEWYTLGREEISKFLDRVLVKGSVQLEELCTG